MSANAQPASEPDLREHPRYDIDHKATVIFDGQSFQCSVKDISQGGVGVTMATAPAVGDSVVLYMQGFGRHMVEVMHAERTRVGFRFQKEELTQRLMLHRLSLLGDRDTPQE